jgi:hypothetical protein
MKLAQIDLAVANCKAHLDSTGSRGTPIEIYLTAHLVVLTCAAFEEQIEATVKERVNKLGDPVVASLVSSAIGIVLRSIKTSELSGVLNRFSEDHKKLFQQKMAANPQAETSFNSIVGQRHNVAHAATFNLTFDDFVKYYESGHTVLDAFFEAVQA